MSQRVRNLTVPRGTRPPHVDRAMSALLESTARAGQIPFGDMCEVTHYVARIERQLRQAELAVRVAKAESYIGRLVDWLRGRR